MNALAAHLITNELRRMGFVITAAKENYRGTVSLHEWNIVQPGVRAILWETQSHGMALSGANIQPDRKEYSININGTWAEVRDRLKKAVKEIT